MAHLVQPQHNQFVLLKNHPWAWSFGSVVDLAATVQMSDFAAYRQLRKLPGSLKLAVHCRLGLLQRIFAFHNEEASENIINP